MAEPYNVDELMRYLTNSQIGAGYVPNFSSDIGEVVEDEGKTFGVGITKAPAAKWDRNQQVANVSDNPITASDAAIQDIPPSGLPTVDAVARARLEKASAEQKREAMLAQASAQHTPQIETLSNSVSLLAQTVSRGGPRLREKYGPDLIAAQEALNAAVNIRDQERSTISVSPEFQTLEASISQSDAFIAAHQGRAQKELEMDARLRTNKDLMSQQTEAQKEQMVADVSPGVADEAYKVLGSVDPATAKETYALRQADIDPAAIKVINEAARNSAQPELNTAVANMSAEGSEFHWWSERYKNSIEPTDIPARTSADVLINEMNAIRAKTSNIMQEKLEGNPQLRALSDQIDQVGRSGEDQREALGYSGLIYQRKQVEKEITADFFQGQVIGSLKGTMLNTNSDLLVVPLTATSPAMQSIASEVVSSVKGSNAATLEDAINEFYTNKVPTLVESGYTNPMIIATVQAVLEDYMESVNSRHMQSGIQLTPADLPTAPMFSIFGNRPMPRFNSAISEFGDL